MTEQQLIVTLQTAISPVVLISGIGLPLFDTPLIIALAGAAVTLGFLIVSLDQMRSSIVKRNEGRVSRLTV